MTVTPPHPDDPLGTWRATLANGLTLLLSPNPEQPRVYCRVAVRAGAADEPRVSTGLAHYLEHILANKGTRRLGTTDHAAEAPILERIAGLYDALAHAGSADRAALIDAISAASAEAAPFAVPNELKQLHGRLGSRNLNAYTSHHQTSYVVEIPSSRLTAWAALEADRFEAPVVRSFQTEVETVREEKKRALDDPNRQSYWAFMRVLWGDHPYATPILGLPEHLLSPSISAMTEFRERWYVPANMAVVLAGDLDPEGTLRLLDAHLGRWPARTVPERATVAPEPLVGERRAEYVHRAPPEVRIGWRTVTPDHPDRVALELLDRVLHNDGNGLLDALSQTESVRACGAWQGSSALGGTFCVWARPRAGQSAAEAEALVLGAVERVRAGDLEPQMLRAILRNVELEESARLESNRGRADLLADAWLQGVDPARTWDDVRAMGALGVADVVRVARRYLGPDRAVLTRVDGAPSLPAMGAPPLPALPAGNPGHSDFFAEVLALPASTPAVRALEEGVDWQDTRTAGLQVVRSDNPHVALQRLTVRFPLGWQSRDGLGPALRLWDRAGVGDLDRPGFERALYALAATADLSPSRWSTDLSITAPGETALEAIALVLDRVRAPVLSEQDAQLVIDDVVERRTQARTTRDHAVSALGAFAARGAQSSYLLRTPRDALRAVAAAGPAGWSAGLIGAEAVVMATGPLSSAALHAAFPSAAEDVAPPATLDYVRPTADRVLFVHHPSVQAQVTLYAPQDGYTPDDYGPRRLTSEIFGGAAGLVFQEVREKRGMAYSARGGLSSGWRAGDANLAWLQAGTEASKASAVAALLLSLFREFPVDAARLDRVRRSTLAHRMTNRIGFRAVPATVVDWIGKGIHADPVHTQLAALADTTDSAVRAYARAAADRPVTLAVVGDRDAIDLGALRALGELTELAVDDLAVH